MEDRKHTPGPWMAIVPPSRQTHNGVDITCCSVFTERTRGELNEDGHEYREDRSHVDNIEIMSAFAWDLSLEEAAANARLIAAAPDLLETLEGLIETAVDAGREHAPSVAKARALLVAQREG